MAQRISDLMTQELRTLRPQATLVEAARVMRDSDIGDVLIVDGDGALAGMVTDRDLVVRAVADGKDPSSCTVGDVCSPELVTVTPDMDPGDAVRLMSRHAVRRLPVVQDGKPVGVLSIGDLAIERDSDSALADISAAPSNN